MSHSLYISDLHLSATRPDLSHAFSDFCRNAARQTDELYILGDLADAWVGNKDDSEAATIIRNELSALTVAGVNVYILISDSDFPKGKELQKICGVSLMQDPSFEDLEAHKTLIVHGNTMCIDDQGFKAFIEQIENPKMQEMLQSKHIEERRQNAVRILARNAKSNEEILQVSRYKVKHVS